MSASSKLAEQFTPEIQQADLPSLIRRLSLRKRVVGAVLIFCVGVSTLLLALFVFGAFDYTRPIPHGFRVALIILCGLYGLAIIAQAGRILVRSGSLRGAARKIEIAAGNKGNALYTFAEISESGAPDQHSKYLLGRLERQAYREWESIDRARFAPIGRAVQGLFLLVFVFLLTISLRVAAPNGFAHEYARLIRLAPDVAVTGTTAGTQPSGAAGSLRIEYGHLSLRIVPPAYSGFPATELPGDGPLRALVNSRLEINVGTSGPVDGAIVEYNGGTSRMRKAGEGQFEGVLPITVSGAFQIRVESEQQALIPPALVRAVEVYPDAPPAIRIEEPKADLLLKAIPQSPLALRWAAEDDLGLAKVGLKYIRSRGEGDAAKFLNGDLPAASTDRNNSRQWRGTAQLDFAKLGAQPGDTFVFWFEAKDNNPFLNNMGRSGSLVVAISSPELARLNLSDLRPNEIARFLLSERKIIIETEKLDRMQARMQNSDFLRRANEIAADQREFKNSFTEFIKIEGSEGENDSSASLEEKAQAASDERTEVHNHGIPDAPQGAPDHVRELVLAIRAMWDAEDALSTGDTQKALTFEKDALARLKRAQTLVRYIPPIAATHRPVDLKRRYQGELTEIKTRIEKMSRQPESKEAIAISDALRETYAAISVLNGLMGVPASARYSGVLQVQEQTRYASDRLVKISGPHSGMIAESAGQIRLVESELSRIETGGGADLFAERLAKPLALLVQAASGLFAIADSPIATTGGETGLGSIRAENVVAEYFRRLNGH